MIELVVSPNNPPTLIVTSPKTEVIIADLPGPPGPPGAATTGYFQGEWVPESEYAESEFVLHSSKMWKASADVPSGEEPGVSSSWTEMPFLAEAGNSSSAGLFRGEWTADEMVWQDVFTSLDSPPWTLEKEHAALAMLPSLSTAPSGAPSGLTTAVKLDCGNVQSPSASRMHLDLAALNFDNVTKFRVHRVSGTYNSNSRSREFRLKRNGLTVYNIRASDSGALSWNLVETPVLDDDVITLEEAGISSTSASTSAHGTYLTQAQVYASAKAFMAGEYVIHEGKLWQALVDNAVGEPGVSASWSEIDLGANLDASSATDGQVLTSDGNGGYQWQTPAADPSALKIYTMGAIPVDAVAPYLVVDPSVSPAPMYYEDGVG